MTTTRTAQSAACRSAIKRRWQATAPLQVLVIIAERYRKQPEKELRRIRAFLGLKSVWFPAEALMEEHVRPEYSELLSAPLREELRRFYAADVQHLRGLLGDPLKDWDADFATFRPPVLLRPRYVVSWLPVGSSTSAESEVSRELVERQRRSPSPTSSGVSVDHTH